MYNYLMFMDFLSISQSNLIYFFSLLCIYMNVSIYLSINKFLSSPGFFSNIKWSIHHNIYILLSHLSRHLSYLSTYLSIYLSIYLCIYLSIYLSIYLCISFSRFLSSSVFSPTWRFLVRPSRTFSWTT